MNKIQTSREELSRIEKEANLKGSLFNIMCMEDVKTEENARQKMTEKIVSFTRAVLLGREELINEEAKSYATLRNFIKKNYFIDTSPFDNVVKSLYYTKIFEELI